MNFETFYKKRSSRRCLGGRGMAQVRTCAVGFPPGRRGNGALRPKAGKGHAHPKGTQYHPSSTRDWKTTPPCGMMGSILL